MSGYIVRDSRQRLVALLPPRFGGEVRTRTDRWLIRVRHHRLGWSLGALELPTHSEAGSVRETALPFGYRIRLASDFSFRARYNPLSSSWTISDGFARLARISDVQQHSYSRPVARITTAESPPRSSVPIALAIVLMFEMIRAEATMPRTDATTGP
jgi:hypothetical protein